MKTCLSALLLCAAILPASAQSSSPSGFPIRVGILTESAGAPSAARVFEKINPGVSVGTEFAFRKGSFRTFLQTINISAYNHSGFGKSLLVTTETGYRYAIGPVHADIKTGTGYALNRSTETTANDGTENIYPKVRGIAHRLVFTGSVSVGVQAGPVAPFISYTAMAQTPSLLDYSQIHPQQMLQVGVTARIGGRSSD